MLQKAPVSPTPVAATHAPKDVLILKQPMGKSTVKTRRRECYSHTRAGNMVD